jgi:hypothetical protein
MCRCSDNTRQVSSNCQIFPIKSVLNFEINEVKNLLQKSDSIVWPDVLLTVCTL